MPPLPPPPRFSDPVSPRIPGAGANYILIPGLSDVAILAGAQSPEILYRWPGPFLISGFWLGEETTADPINVALLRLRMQDVTRNELISDGNGNVDDAPGLAWMGLSPRWQPFRHVVRSGQKWLLQIANTSSVTLIPQLYFKIEVEQ